jgi:MYXO-CTERM domain-containing protein
MARIMLGKEGMGGDAMRQKLAFVAAALLLLVPTTGRANPIPMPRAGGSQIEGTQDVGVGINTTYNCPEGTVYRGTRLIEETGMYMLDLDHADTVAVADVDCSMASSEPDPFSSGVTHYSVGVTDTCVPPGQYYYQLFAGDSPTTWIESYGMEDVPDPLVVEAVDTSCLPSDNASCSIATSAPAGSAAPALALLVLGLLLALRRRV